MLDVLSDGYILHRIVPFGCGHAVSADFRVPASLSPSMDFFSRTIADFFFLPCSMSLALPLFGVKGDMVF